MRHADFSFPGPGGWVGRPKGSSVSGYGGDPHHSPGRDSDHLVVKPSVGCSPVSDRHSHLFIPDPSCHTLSILLLGIHLLGCGGMTAYDNGWSQNFSSSSGPEPQALSPTKGLPRGSSCLSLLIPISHRALGTHGENRCFSPV